MPDTVMTMCFGILHHKNEVLLLTTSEVALENEALDFKCITNWLFLNKMEFSLMSLRYHSSRLRNKKTERNHASSSFVCIINLFDSRNHAALSLYYILACAHILLKKKSNNWPQAYIYHGNILETFNGHLNRIWKRIWGILSVTKWTLNYSPEVSVFHCNVFMTITNSILLALFSKQKSQNRFRFTPGTQGNPLSEWHFKNLARGTGTSRLSEWENGLGAVEEVEKVSPTLHLQYIALS